MWPCCGVHITVCMALLIFVLCQPVHSCIEPSIHGLDFIFYGDLFLFFFDKNLNLLRGAIHIIAIDTSSAHVCCQMASNSQYALPPQSSPLPCKKAQVVNPSYDQSKGSSLENFVTIGGHFKIVTIHIAITTADLGRLFRRKHLFPGDDIAMKTWIH